MKAVIVVLSDPKSGSDGILFQGAGTRWIGEVSKSDHAAHALFEEVKDKVAGVSSGCADVFGATEDAEKSGFDLIKDNPVPGTSGLPSLHNLIAEGYAILTF